MRFGSPSKVLAECKLKYYIISKCHILPGINCWGAPWCSNPLEDPCPHLFCLVGQVLDAPCSAVLPVASGSSKAGLLADSCLIASAPSCSQIQQWLILPGWLILCAPPTHHAFLLDPSQNLDKTAFGQLCDDLVCARGYMMATLPPL